LVVSQCDLGIYRDGSRGFEALEFRGKVREALRLLISVMTLVFDRGIYHTGQGEGDGCGKVREALRLLISEMTLVFLTADWKSAEKIVLLIRGRDGLMQRKGGCQG
jgi:hypothetical protein